MKHLIACSFVIIACAGCGTLGNRKVDLPSGKAYDVQPMLDLAGNAAALAEKNPAWAPYAKGIEKIIAAYDKQTKGGGELFGGLPYKVERSYYLKDGKMFLDTDIVRTVTTKTPIAPAAIVEVTEGSTVAEDVADDAQLDDLLDLIK